MTFTEYQDGLDLAARIQDEANAIFNETVRDDASIRGALHEICDGAHGITLALGDVLLTDDAEVGRRVRIAVLKWLARDSEVMANRRFNV